MLYLSFVERVTPFFLHIGYWVNYDILGVVADLLKTNSLLISIVTECHKHQQIHYFIVTECYKHQQLEQNVHWMGSIYVTSVMFHLDYVYQHSLLSLLHIIQVISIETTN